MFKLRWMFPFFLCVLFIADNEGGAPDDKATDAPGEEQDTQSPEDAVLDAIGLNDEADTAAPETVATVDTGETKPEGEPEESKPEETASEKPEAEAQSKPQDALTDADLAPLDSKNPKTNERFQKVTEGYKQEKQRADSLQEEVLRYQQSFDSLRQLGYTDEGAAHDLVNFSEYRKAIYSGDEKTFARIIGEQIKQFETLYGKRISVSASALDDHPDLLEKVTALELDESTALELARSRSLQNRISREAENRTQHQQSAEAQSQELDGAVEAVQQMQNKWQSNDPDFPAILPHLQPMMTEIGRSYPPALWPQLLDLQYKALKKALASSQSHGRNNTPLRGHGHQGARPAPATPQEAVLQELGLDA